MKKGFTLIELMGVIVILAILSIITVVGVDKMLSDGRNNLYEDQVKIIELSAKSYIAENPSLKPLPGEITTITIQDLVDNGFLKENINNPKTEENFDLTLKIEIKRTENSLSFELLD